MLHIWDLPEGQVREGRGQGTCQQHTCQQGPASCAAPRKRGRTRPCLPLTLTLMLRCLQGALLPVHADTQGAASNPPAPESDDSFEHVTHAGESPC